VEVRVVLREGVIRVLLGVNQLKVIKPEIINVLTDLLLSEGRATSN
jgi:hypothetical protein